MNFEYYVLNYNFNGKKIEHFNIFNNIYVQEETEKEIKRYLRSAKKYSISDRDGNILYGFDALCERIRKIIMYEEWGRCEYEIAVGGIFITEIHDVVRKIDDYKTLDELKDHLEKLNKKNEHLEKWDCYRQCLPNIRMITRDLIYQYKEQIKC